jgi:type III secretion protein D
MSREVLLGIFSGVHAGAELLLAEGEYSLGTAEENDLIFTDSALAPRHCLLIVPPQGQVRLRALEGELALTGGAVQKEEFALAPSTPLLAGKVCLAWIPGGERWGQMRMPSLLPEAEQVGGNNVGAKAESAAAQAAPAPAGAAPTGRTPASAKPEDAARPARKNGLKFLLRAALALVLLLGLLLSVKPGTEGKDRLEELRADLEAAGFAGLLPGERGGLAVIYGLVDSEEQIEQVRAIASRRPYQVQLVIRTKEAHILLARSILAAHGLFPSITLEKGEILLRGYALDKLVERAGISWLKNGLPELAPLKSDFVTREETAPVLRRELERAGLADTTAVSWAPGLVELQPAAQDAERGLQSVIAATRRALGYPVAFQLRSGREGTQIHLEETPLLEETRVSGLMETAGLAEERGTPARNPFGESVSLRSVAVPGEGKTEAEALPFITTSDGRLYFVGGRLPSGYVLTGIFSDRLEFGKNNANLAYKLRGN